MKTNIRWRIYTECIGNGIAQKTIIDKYFKGYTVYRGVGAWEGKLEKNLTLEILGSDADRINILALVVELRDGFKQECVMVTEESVTVAFI